MNTGDDEDWDDTELRATWNAALAEYKKYHSIHNRSEPATHVYSQPMTQPADAAANEPKSGHNTSTNTEEQEQPMEVSKPEEEEEEEVTNGPHKSSSGLPYIPITSLPATKDEALKSLILSWYHTGYYQGYYDGLNKQEKNTN